MSYLCNLRDFIKSAKTAKRLYIYGAGTYGSLCHKLLTINRINVAGFIVTKKDEDFFLGKKIYEFDNIYDLLNRSDCILVAMSSKNSSSLVNELKKTTAKTIVVPEELFKHESYLGALKQLSRIYPARKYTVTQNWNNILVIRIDRMGDLIWTSAFFRELRNSFQNAKITALIEKSNYRLMEKCPHVDRVVTFDEGTFDYGRNKWWLMFHYTKEMSRNIFNNERYDVVFLPRGQDGYMLSNMFFAIHSEARNVVGNCFDANDTVDSKLYLSIKRLFSILVTHDTVMHEVAKQLDMLRAIGCNVQSEKTELYLPPRKGKVYREIQSYLECKNIIPVVVGLVSRDKNRSWNPNNYRLLFDNLGKKYNVFFILCGDSESGNAAEIAKKSIYAFDCTGRTDLDELIAIMDEAKLYIGSNTGLTHIAAALGKPVVEISNYFTWGRAGALLSPEECGPWRVKSITLQPSTALTEECRKSNHCISEQSHCINTITVKAVQDAVEKMFTKAIDDL